MGVRERLLSILNKRPAPETDPDELIEIMAVPLYEGPLLVAALEKEGIASCAIEAFNVVTKTLSHVRISVASRDAVAALAILNRIRT
jgi:hypothetical protein